MLCHGRRARQITKGDEPRRRAGRYPRNVPCGHCACNVRYMVEIPKGNRDTPGPCWIPIVRYDDERIPCKPLVKCLCGVVTGIGLHHVHADGVVTASYFHSQDSEFTHNGKKYGHQPGCGWHVFLKLLDYDQGDFPSEP
jgi:hypothetical protein